VRSASHSPDKEQVGPAVMQWRKENGKLLCVAGWSHITATCCVLKGTDKKGVISPRVG